MSLPSGSRPGRIARARAGGEDDVLGVTSASLAVLPVDGDLALALEPRRRPSTTAILFFFIRKPTPRRAGPRPCASVRTTLAISKPTSLPAAGRSRPAWLMRLQDLGRAQQRLGRDAAPVEADAAQCSRSMMAVLSPSCAARMAAT